MCICALLYINGSIVCAYVHYYILMVVLCVCICALLYINGSIVCAYVRYYILMVALCACVYVLLLRHAQLFKPDLRCPHISKIGSELKQT